MFGFAAKKSVDAAPHIRRIVDLTSPNRPLTDDARGDCRYSRSFPVLICPWSRSKVNSAEAQLAISRDFSDTGIGVLTMQEMGDGPLVVSAWPSMVEMDEPYHFLTEVRGNRELVPGIWALSLKIDEFLNNSYQKRLIELNALMSDIFLGTVATSST